MKSQNPMRPYQKSQHTYNESQKEDRRMKKKIIKRNSGLKLPKLDEKH